MPKLKDVCRHVRSKNAGPFWITVDIFFKGAEEFQEWAHAPSLEPTVIAETFQVDESSVKHFLIPSLHVVKFSYPRHKPQGGAFERDMHGGQQYVALLDLELEEAE